MGKGSKRRPEDDAALERNWPFPPKRPPRPKPPEPETPAPSQFAGWGNW